MNPVEKVRKRSLKPTTLLLAEKNIDKEVEDYKEKLSVYGIKNSTVKKINTKSEEIENKKQETGKKQAINILIEAFAPFAIVTYKTLDEVCKDHQLVISSISNYDKAIPDDNIYEMDNFVDKLKSISHNTLEKISIIKNDCFTFENTRSSIGGFIKSDDYYRDVLGTEQMFKVAAPKNHFDIPKNHIRIGNEYSTPLTFKPKFTYDFKVNKPTFELDPIVFIPIQFLNKTFCIIVTAWDKVADDSRILSKL